MLWCSLVYLYVKPEKEMHNTGSKAGQCVCVLSARTWTKLKWVKTTKHWKNLGHYSKAKEKTNKRTSLQLWGAFSVTAELYMQWRVGMRHSCLLPIYQSCTWLALLHLASIEQIIISSFLVPARNGTQRLTLMPEQTQITIMYTTIAGTNIKKLWQISRSMCPRLVRFAVNAAHSCPEPTNRARHLIVPLHGSLKFVDKFTITPSTNTQCKNKTIQKHQHKMCGSL